MPNEKKQFNIYLEAELIKEVKRAAIDAHGQGMSLSDFVEEALRVYLRLSSDPEGYQRIVKIREEFE